VIYSFDRHATPVLEVDPGSVVLFETQDCFGGQLESETDLVTSIDFAYANPATGPVAVRGAEPGDSLVVEILSIQTSNRGFTTIAPGVGQLADRCAAPATKVFSIEDGVIHFTDRLHLPIRPMLGVIGVAPAADPVPTLHPGEHGGNLDDRYHAAGTTIYFPVRCSGGLFAVGDMHATMGDGEICGTGVEVPGEVMLRFSVLKGKMGRFPISETARHWITHGVGQNYPEALDAACQEAASLLTQEWHLTMEEAFMLLSVCGDAGVCQSCQPCSVASTARMMVPKLGSITGPFA
jgi:amidase